MEWFQARRENNLRVTRKRISEQATPQDVIDRVTRFILFVKRKFAIHIKKYETEHVFAIDETAVWHDSVGTTTVESTGSKTEQLHPWTSQREGPSYSSKERAKLPKQRRLRKEKMDGLMKKITKNYVRMNYPLTSFFDLLHI